MSVAEGFLHRRETPTATSSGFFRIRRFIATRHLLLNKTKKLHVEAAFLNMEAPCLTVLFDHDVIDGAPAARFVHCLVALIESGYGLDENQSSDLKPPAAGFALP
jgi:hypothetical protein